MEVFKDLELATFYNEAATKMNEKWLEEEQTIWYGYSKGPLMVL